MKPASSPREPRTPRPQRASRGPRAEGDSRADILEAARELFAAKGFKATTTRQVAERASVDVSLIHHFFGTKAELFAAAINLGGIAAAIGEQLVAADGGDPAEGLARLYLERLFPTQQRTLSAVLRTALGSPDEMPQLRELMQRTVVPVASEAIGGPDAALRGELIGAQMLGCLLMRHVVGVEPIASASVDDLVRLLAPSLRVLMGREQA